MKKEIELKYQLKSKSDLERFKLFLKPYLSGKKIIYHQANFYFDTPLLNLRRRGISLRLRRQNNDFLLCAKQSLREKKPKKKHLSVRLEYEGAVEKPVADLMQADCVSPIEVFATLKARSADDEETKNTLHRHMRKASKIGLQMIGSFVNERTILPILLGDQKIDLEFDHSIYPKSLQVFEVEVEFETEKQATMMGPLLEGLFDKAHIKTYESCSKSSRLYKLLYGSLTK